MNQFEKNTNKENTLLSIAVTVLSVFILMLALYLGLKDADFDGAAVPVVLSNQEIQ